MSKNTNLSFLTDYITADITNGRIGINNASPAYAFDVTGIARTSTSTYLATASGNVGIGTTSPLVATGYTSISINNATNGGILDLQQNGTSVMRVGNNGTTVAFIETRTATPLTFSTNDTLRLTIASTGAATFTNSVTVGTGGNLRLSSNSNEGEIVSAFGKGMKFYTNDGNSNPLNLTSAGNVGIGTSSPGAKLDVTGNIRSFISNISGLGGNISLLNDFGNNGGHTLINMQNAGTICWIKAAINGPNSNSGADLLFATPSTDTNGTERMRITSGGNVGIGTSSPSQRLHVYNSSSSTVAIFQGPTNSYIQLGTSSESYIGNVSGALTFEAGGSERMRITSAGFVGIGTSGPNYVTTIADSTWSNGSTVSYLFNIRKAYGVGVVFGCYIGEYSQDSTGFTINQKVFNQAPATTQTFTINNSGNYSFWGSNVSDKRLKRNINYIQDSQLDKIMLLKPATFNKIIDNEINTNVHTGFIAQDILESNIPNLIMGSEETSYGLDYDGILALAVKSIQELSTEINLLKQK